MKTDELEPGPALDKIVAERVMKWERGGVCWLTPAIGPAIDEWHPSVDICAAWEVVEKFKDYDWKLESHGQGETFIIYKDGTYYAATAESAMLAICRAALIAIEKK